MIKCADDKRQLFIWVRSGTRPTSSGGPDLRSPTLRDKIFGAKKTASFPSRNAGLHQIVNTIVGARSELTSRAALISRR